MRHSWIMTVIPCFRLQQVPFHHVLLFVSQLLGSREVTIIGKMLVVSLQAQTYACCTIRPVIDIVLSAIWTACFSRTGSQMPKISYIRSTGKRVSLKRPTVSSAMSCNLHMLQKLSAINDLKYTGVVMHLHK